MTVESVETEAWRRTCNDEGPVDYCAKCFDRAQHAGHRVVARASPNARCYCDCGAMSSGKLVGPQCKKHKAESPASNGDDGAEDMGAMLAALLARSLAED